MSGPTKIEWADAVWNPVTGCSKVSAGCTHCYAERQAMRFAGRAGYPADDPFRLTLHPDRLDEPLHWRKPRRIFVCSMSDLFHPNVDDGFIADVWTVLDACQQHTFLILTKRPERMASLTGIGDAGKLWELPNVWLGSSIEDQPTADERIAHLLRCRAAVRFVSYEPALGPVNFRRLDHARLDALAGMRVQHVEKLNAAGLPSGGEYSVATGGKLDWMIAGGESGPKARPVHPDWFRRVRDDCAAAGVPFFLKQHGEWASRASGMPRARLCETYRRGFVGPSGRFGGREVFHEDGCQPVWRVGKKAAGRLLDGVEHNAYPGEGRS